MRSLGWRDSLEKVEKVKKGKEEEK